MVHNLAGKITEWLIQNGTISLQNKENYWYGIEVTIEKLITYSFLLILSIVLNVVIPSILFLAFFIFLRGYAGGFHAKTFWGCFISTIVLYVVFSRLIAPFFIAHSKYVLPSILLCFMIVLFLAPMNHPNLHLSHKELEKCKIGSRVVLVIETILIILGDKSGINTVYVVFPLLGTLMCTVLLILEKLNQKEVE